MHSGIVFFLIVVQVQLSPFSPHHVPHPIHPRFPTSNLLPLGLSMGPLNMVLDGLSPIFPQYPSLPSPLVSVSLFFISMSLVIFCLLIQLIRFHLQVRSYGICLFELTLSALHENGSSGKFCRCSLTYLLYRTHVWTPSFILWWCLLDD